MPESIRDKQEEFNVDEAMDRIEAINKRLAREDLPLKEALELYKQGAELARKCQEQLEGVEKELVILNV